MNYLSTHRQAIITSIKNSVTFLFSCIFKGKNYTYHQMGIKNELTSNIVGGFY